MQPTASELLALRARETTYPGAASTSAPSEPTFAPYSTTALPQTT
jgi:hypothetical protein